MITLLDVNGKKHYVSAENVARVSEAGPNSQGIHSYVKLFDGQTVECDSYAENIVKQVDLAKRVKASSCG